MNRLYGFAKQMHIILTKGSRPFTEKMYKTTIEILKRPEFDEIKMIEQKAKAKELIEKINTVYDLVMSIDGEKHPYYISKRSAIPFIKSIKDQVNKKYWLSND